LIQKIEFVNLNKFKKTNFKCDKGKQKGLLFPEKKEKGLFSKVGTNYAAENIEIIQEKKS